MSTTISVLGGVGLFQLEMSVMTSGLTALAGSGLRATLSKAAATPSSGAFWGAFITLIVQSSSATTMTTIGLVSAGLLTLTQGLGLVFGANIGTTGTAWLIALFGVRFAHGRRITDHLCGRFDQVVGPWTCVCGRWSACWVCPGALRIDHPPARDGWNRRTVAPGRPSCRLWPRCQLGG